VRILITTNTTRIVGGVETYVKSLLTTLPARGHEVALGALERAPGDPLLKGTNPDAVTDLARGTEVLGEMAAWRPDVVYNQHTGSPELERELVRRFPVLLFAHAFYGGCISGTKCHARRDYRTCERALGPGCLAVYHLNGCGGSSPWTMWKLYREQRTRQKALRMARLVGVASRYMEGEVRREGVCQERIRLLPLFPVAERPSSGPAERSAGGRVVVIGRVTEPKGAGLIAGAIVAAERELGTSLTLVVIGDGPDLAAVRRDSENAGLRAEFPGWLDPMAVASELARADALLFPSLWPEPFGIAGVEAAAAGVPAVGFGVGGTTDWLIDGVTGVVAAERTGESLGRALARALDETNHPALRAGALAKSREFLRDAHLEKLEAALAEAAA
jgi:glycosyltransferase involved in cell wall biosynthesis